MEGAQAHIASEDRTNLLLLVVVPYSKTCRLQSINHPSIQPSSTSMLRLALYLVTSVRCALFWGCALCHSPILTHAWVRMGGHRLLCSVKSTALGQHSGHEEHLPSVRCKGIAVGAVSVTSSSVNMQPRAPCESSIEEHFITCAHAACTSAPVQF
jgi:hypothetical protein